MWFLGGIATLLWNRQSFQGFLTQVTNMPNSWWKCRFTVLLGRFYSGQNIFTGPVKTEGTRGKHCMETYLPNRLRRPSWSRTSLWLPWLASTDTSTLYLHTHAYIDVHMQRYIYTDTSVRTQMTIYTHMNACVYRTDCTCVSAYIIYYVPLYFWHLLWHL